MFPSYFSLFFPPLHEVLKYRATFPKVQSPMLFDVRRKRGQNYSRVMISGRIEIATTANENIKIEFRDYRFTNINDFENLLLEGTADLCRSTNTAY